MPYTIGVKQHFLAQNIIYGIVMVGTCIRSCKTKKKHYKNVAIVQRAVGFPTTIHPYKGSFYDLTPFRIDKCEGG